MNSHVKSSSTHYWIIIDKFLVFKKLGQTQSSRLQGKKLRKGIVVRNTQVKYQRSSTHCSKIIRKVKVTWKYFAPSSVEIGLVVLEKNFKWIFGFFLLLCCFREWHDISIWQALMHSPDDALHQFWLKLRGFGKEDF